LGATVGLGKLLGVSTVVMGLSHTIARERLFEGLRARLGGRDTWLGYLMSCPYCVSHWVAFLLVPLTGTYAIDVIPRLGPFAGILRWFFSSILVAMVASFLRVAFYFVDENQGLAKRRQKVAERQAESETAEQAVIRQGLDGREGRQGGRQEGRQEGRQGRDRRDGTEGAAPNLHG
jgi:hypothetical protein